MGALRDPPTCFPQAFIFQFGTAPALVLFVFGWLSVQLVYVETICSKNFSKDLFIDGDVVHGEGFLEILNQVFAGLGCVGQVMIVSNNPSQLVCSELISFGHCT